MSGLSTEFTINFNDSGAKSGIDDFAKAAVSVLNELAETVNALKKNNGDLANSIATPIDETVAAADSVVSKNGELKESYDGVKQRVVTVVSTLQAFSNGITAFASDAVTALESVTTNTSTLARNIAAEFNPITRTLNNVYNAFGVITNGAKKAVTAVGTSLQKWKGDLDQLGQDNSIAIGLQRTAAGIYAVTRTSQEGMQSLINKAKELGAATPFTAIQSLQGIETLSRAGLKASESVNTITDVLNLATGNMIGMGEAASMTTNIMGIFGISSENTARVVDVLSKGASLANTTVSDLALAIQYSGGSAKAIGLSYESLVAILDSLAKAGIRSEKAGTALRNMLGQISDPASKAREELRKIGANTSNFHAAIKAIASSGKEGENAIRAFGIEAGPALRALVDQSREALEGGANAMLEFETQLKNSAGFTAESAQIMKNTAAGALIELQSAWDALKLSIQEPFTEPLQEHTEFLTATLNLATNAVEKFKEIFPGTTAAIAGTLVKVTTLMGVLGVLAKLVIAPLILLIKSTIVRLSIMAGTFVKVGASGTAGAAKMGVFSKSLFLVKGAAMSLITTLRALAVQFFLIYAPIIAAFETWEFLSKVIDDSEKSLHSYNEKLKEVKENQKLDATGNLSEQLTGKTKAELETLKQELIAQSSALNEAEGALYSASSGVNPLEAFGVDWDAIQIGGLSDSELATKMQELGKESGNVRQQLVAVSEALKNTASPDVKMPDLKIDIPDSKEDILSFFDSLNGLNNTTADEKILQVNSALKETLATINGDTDPQKIILANQTAMDAIVNIEQEKAAKSIELAERTYTAKADYIQKNQADEQGNKLTATQQAEQLKQAAQELAAARVAASQQALDATRSHLSQAKTDYDSYAQKVRELEQAIVEEKSRQSQTLRDLERAGMSDYAAFQDKKKELASLSAEFEQAMQERNYSKAQEIAKKREALAKSLAAAGDVKDDNGDVLISKEDARRQAVDAVKDSYAQVNEAMAAQKQVTEENANSQKTYVDSLQKQVEVIEGIVASVQQKEIALKLRVNEEELNKELDSIQERIRQKDFKIAMKMGDKEAITQSLETINTDSRVIMYKADVSTEKAKEKLQALQSETAQETIEQKLIYQKDATFTDDEKKLNSPAQKVVIFNPDTSQFDTVLARISKNTESVHTIKVKEVRESGGSDLPAFATGGHVRGAGTGTSDSILARLSDGEFIIPAAAVKNYGVDFLNSLRSQKFNLPAFATGGIVSTGLKAVKNTSGLGGISNTINNFLQNDTDKAPAVFNIAGVDKPIAATFGSTDDVRNLAQALKKMGMAR